MKGGANMHKVFMNAKEVQEVLEVSRTTAYQLINEMNQELVKSRLSSTKRESES